MFRSVFFVLRVSFLRFAWQATKVKEVLKVPLKATLYHHQQSACRFACERFGILPSEIHSNGVALLMEMGCGKTITSIAIVGILYQYRHIRRILITAPLL